MKYDLPTQVKNELLHNAEQIYTNYLNRSRIPNASAIPFLLSLEDSLDDTMRKMVRNNDDLDDIDKGMIFKLIRQAILNSPERCRVNSNTTDAKRDQKVELFKGRLKALIEDAFLEEETQETRLELPAIYL
ncbi:MAG: hypothetical protein P1U32_07870 [Legionellaceae bacterium]|nr:hypothetical protein [Legionellaceae bacterium]